MKAPRVGATEAGTARIGLAIYHASGPMLAVLTTVEITQHFAMQRLWTHKLDCPNMGIGGITLLMEMKKGCVSSPDAPHQKQGDYHVWQWPEQHLPGKKTDAGTRKAEVI